MASKGTNQTLQSILTPIPNEPTPYDGHTTYNSEKTIQTINQLEEQTQNEGYLSEEHEKLMEQLQRKKEEIIEYTNTIQRFTNNKLDVFTKAEYGIAKRESTLEADRIIQQIQQEIQKRQDITDSIKTANKGKIARKIIRDKNGNMIPVYTRDPTYRGQNKDNTRTVLTYNHNTNNNENVVTNTNSNQNHANITNTFDDKEYKLNFTE